MGPFLYPDKRHSRSQTPGPFGDYRRYKPHLRIEFARQCVYCRLPDGLKGEDAFGVDHYRPASRFPALLSAYENLYYCCNTCNRRKGNFWPTDQQREARLFIPNPCDQVMEDHFTFRGARVATHSKAGQFAVEILMLNDEPAVQYREFVLRSVERCLSQAASISEIILDLRSRLSESAGPDRANLEVDLWGLKAELLSIMEDYERLTGHGMPRASE